MARVAGAGDDQHVRASLQCPGQPDLRAGGAVFPGGREYFLVLGPGDPGAAACASDREERHERDALLPAGVHELVFFRARAEEVPVLQRSTAIAWARSRGAAAAARA